MKPDVSLQLRQIARALDMPVETFFTEASSGIPMAGGLELLRCWQHIADADQRERLLALARELAGTAPAERVAAE